MARAPDSELLGSNDTQIALGPEPVRSEIALANAPLRTYAASFTANSVSAQTPGEPDRLFLKLRNIRGNQGACVFDVSVSVPGAAHPPVRVGSLALFGIEKASDPNSDDGGSGLTRTIEITEATDRYLPELKKAGRIVVTISPRGKMGPGDKISIQTMGLYRLPAQ
jgi:hypothetical protein